MRTLLITGGSSEVGKTIILDQEKNFDQIIVHCSSKPERLAELQELLGEKLKIICADFSNEQETMQMALHLKKEGAIPTDIIHLPAGKFELKNFSKLSWNTFKTDLNISLRSITCILNVLLPEMAKKKQGRIIIMLSAVTSGVPPKYLSSYIVSKYALLGLVRGLAAEYAEKGISINGVSPEMMDTKYLNKIPDMVKEINRNNSPRKRLLIPKDILPVFRMLLSEDSNAVTGQNIIINDGK